MPSKIFFGLGVSAVVCWLLILTGPVLGQTGSLNEDLGRSFNKFKLARFENLRELRAGPGRDSLMIPTTERNYELILKPHDLRSPHYRAQETGAAGPQPLAVGPIVTFKGLVRGEPDSHARLSITDEKIEGYFIARANRYFIEPARRYSPLAGDGDFVVYADGDLLKNEIAVCPLDEKIEQERTAIETRFSPSARLLREIELATDADFQFVSALGGAAQANMEILSIMNMVEGVYELELGLTFTIVFQNAWTMPDPYAGTTVEDVLRSFQNYWNANFPPARIPRDTAQLWSGKSHILRQGLAFVGVICTSPAYAYGVSGRTESVPAKFALPAHEIGHNLNASHVGDSQGCANTIMYYQLTALTQFTFCPYSRSEINGFVASSGGCLSQRFVATTPFDFDGDGRTDISIFRPSTGEWWIARSSTEQVAVTRFGTSTDVLAPADFTGDGRSDIAVWRPGTASWFVLRSENLTFYSFPFGQSGDIPAPEDFDGDGRADPTVFRPSTGTWYILNSRDGSTTIRAFGVSGDAPVPADYDGDGRADLAIFRRVSGEWWLARSASGQVSVFQFGASSDRPVPGDYTGDGRADVALWRPSNGNWYVLRSENLTFYSFPFGASGDVPVPGDYDGDERWDAAVFRPSGAIWFINRSSSGTLIRAFGTTGDIPVPSAFVR